MQLRLRFRKSLLLNRGPDSDVDDVTFYMDRGVLMSTTYNV